MFALFKSRVLKKRRQKALGQVRDEAFRALLSGDILSRAPWRQHQFLAVDIETTGLDPRVDDVVSFGWVPIAGGRIQVGDAVRLLVKTKIRINESATVHGIRHQDMSQGIGIGDALTQLIAALTGRVLLVHYAGLDKVLLDRLCLERYGAKLWVPAVDTLELARRRFRHQTLEHGEFRLMALCERFGLPRVRQHDALNDALATAQLFLALVTRSSPDEEATLSELMC